MKKRKINQNVRLANIVLLITLFFFAVLLARAGQLSLLKEIDGINLSSFASKRTIKRETISAKRGTIYDANGDVLAQNVYSYTLIAYLEESRGDGNYVKDKEMTAEKLATVIDMSYEKILTLLNKDVYQTEFGTAGKGLTELKKDEILALGLDGIDFSSNQKRYYPNGAYLSYTLGYAKSDSDGNIVGEMGIEALFNDYLDGTDGYREYQKDRKGYKIPNTYESVQEAVDGSDIYLTIDASVQFFIEEALSEAEKNYNFDELNIIVAEAKTGKILGLSSTTSFDPNTREISSYLDPNVAVAFEPGSTMKIYTYMAALETGLYDGDKTFKSGKYETTDGTMIRDSNRKGWGTISYDRGFALSSNVGIVNLINDYMDRDYLLSYFKKLGFGSKTGIDLSKESSGKLGFKYETEIYNAGFGQGIMVTGIQNIKALTSIANDGILLEPYIIDKIVDSNGNVVLENSRTEIERVASKETTDKIRDLMETVVTEGTGSIYNMPEYDLIAKTGTAQIASTNGTGYLKGSSDYIRGFAGMFPKDDPQIIIYANVKRPRNNNVKSLTSVVKSVVENVGKYYNIYGTETIEKTDASYKVGNYINQDLEDVREELESNNIEVVVIGNGERIINQYPSKDITVVDDSKVFLVTNGNEITIPSFKGWSKKDVITYLTKAGIKYQITGNGYLKSQSVVNVVYKDDMIIELVFEEKYKE